MVDKLHEYVTQELIPEMNFLGGQLDALLLAREAAGVGYDALGDDPEVAELETALADLGRQHARLKRLACAHKMRADGHVPEAFLERVFAIR